MFDARNSDHINIGCQLGKLLSITPPVDTLQTTVRQGKIIHIDCQHFYVTVYCKMDCDKLCKGS